MLRWLLNSMPRQLTSRIVESFPRLVPHLDDRDVQIRISNPYYGGARFSLSNRFRVERELLYQRAYDPKTLLYAIRLVSPGDICIDIGANIGAISLSLANRVGSSGRVIAFEPGPMLFDRLARNVALSGRTNIEIVRGGLSDSEEILYWRLEEGENAGNAFLSRDGNGVAVPIYRLDDHPATQSLQRLDFIKIDVEGMELNVIRGAASTISKFKPAILVETLFDQGAIERQSTFKVLEELRTKGYGFWEIDVPEKQLVPFEASFEFIRCEFPKLPQNTLCIHESRTLSLYRS